MVWKEFKFHWVYDSVSEITLTLGCLRGNREAYIPVVIVQTLSNVNTNTDFFNYRDFIINTEIGYFLSEKQQVKLSPNVGEH